MWETWHEASSTSNVTYSAWLADSVRRGQTEDEGGAAGVRVPRRPVAPRDSAGAALDLPRLADPAPTFGYVI
jgi:hypothetical protein